MATPLRRATKGPASPRFSLRSSHRNPLRIPVSHRAGEAAAPQAAALNAHRDAESRRRDGHGGRRDKPRR